MQGRELTIDSGTEGVSLHVREWGVGSDACLLIHGFGEGAYVWDRFVPSIAQFFRTLTIDLRGHGESSWDPTRDYSIESHVADVARVVDELRIGRVVLIGHSLGGEIAIRIAASRLNNVVGMVVLEFGPEHVSEGAARVRSDFNDSLRTWSSVSQYVSWLRGLRPLPDMDTIEYFASRALRADPGGGFRPKCDPALASADKHEDRAKLWGLLERISCPVLIIRGIASAVLSADVAVRMKSVLLDSSLHVLPGAGHAVMSDNPEGCSEVLVAFLLKLYANAHHKGGGVPSEVLSADSGREGQE
jgi:pimeloyl-ACP methyl ester carboxylesterase